MKITASSSAEFERLPKNVVPRNYTVTLKPDLKKCTFEGSETVQLEIVEPTDRILLNYADLEISNVKLTLRSEAGVQVISPNKTGLSPETEVLSLIFSTIIPVGNAELRMDFSGVLNDKLKGFYRSKYNSTDGEIRYSAVTQMAPYDCRRCFPCWDEPAIKATFDIRLIVSNDLVALSNMPISTDEPYPSDPTLHKLSFQQTPKMSTYLVAFAIGEFEYIECNSRDGVLIRVYTPMGKKEQGQFALDVATKVLPYYADYFQVSFPLPKLDLIAIADFAFGAMENWGLVTYRESRLLFDPKHTSVASKQIVALIVAHELAHMWFGNLVTMEWWTHLWLNEGYARFCEFLCVDHIFPEFQIWSQFVNDCLITALDLDCLDSSHPIEVPIGNPSEIDEIFDVISYSKGASIIRMLHSYIGDTDFRNGMNIYLTRHQYGNTQTEDLWAALEEASKKPVGSIMSTWTKQLGFPVITVDTKIDGNDVLVTLSQRKFCADGSSSDKCLWMVPISIVSSNQLQTPLKELVLDQKSTEIVLPNTSEKDWIKINPGFVGVYRTKYSTQMLELFIPAIRDRNLPTLDRLSLLDDVFAMVQAGHTPTVEALKLVEACHGEVEYAIWSSIIGFIGKLSNILSHTECHGLLKQYGCRVFENIYSEIGWNPKENESHLVKLLRSLVIARLGAFSHLDVQNVAKNLLDKHVAGTTLIGADIRGPVYRAALSGGGEQVFEALLKLYRESDMHEEKNRISVSLGATNKEHLLARVVDFAMSDEVRSQDSIFVLTSASRSKVGKPLVWKYFKSNIKEFQTRYKGSFLASRLVKGITENFTSEDDAKDVSSFFEEYPFPGTERSVQQGIESIRLNAAWLQRDQESIKEYLSRA